MGVGRFRSRHTHCTHACCLCTAPWRWRQTYLTRTRDYRPRIRRGMQILTPRKPKIRLFVMQYVQFRFQKIRVIYLSQTTTSLFCLPQMDHRLSGLREREEDTGGGAENTQSEGRIAGKRYYRCCFDSNERTLSCFARRWILLACWR